MSQPPTRYIISFILFREGWMDTLLVLIWALITAMRISRGALCGGVDGPRAGGGWSTTWRRGYGSCLTSRTVRVCTEAVEFAGEAWILLPRGPHRGGEILGFVLGSAGHPRCL